MSEHEEPKSYEVEPEAPKAPKAKLEGKPLTDDFDEDADFDHDPEVAAALGPKKKRKAKREDETPEGEKPLVRAGMGPWRFWAGAGGVALLAGLVLAALDVSGGSVAMRDKWFWHSLLVVYNGLLHTGTGVAAIFVTAQILERKFGSVELATGRMLAAMGAFLLVFHLPITLLPVGKLEEWALAALAYVLVLAVTFRFGRVALAIVVGAHFGLWLIVQLGMTLSQWTVTAPAGTP